MCSICGTLLLMSSENTSKPKRKTNRQPKKSQPKRSSQRAKTLGAIYSHPVKQTDIKLAKTIGTKLEAIRLGRGLTRQAVARQLGVGTNYYADIERGRLIPGAEVQRRLLHWATENMTFEKAPSLKSLANHTKTGWKKVTVLLPPALHQKLRLASDDAHLSIAGWIYIAIERLLKYPNFNTMLKESFEEIQRARVLQLLERFPDLVALTSLEEAYAIEVGLKSPKQPQAEVVRPDKSPYPYHQLAQLPVASHGVAEKVSLLHDPLYDLQEPLDIDLNR